MLVQDLLPFRSFLAITLGFVTHSRHDRLPDSMTVHDVAVVCASGLDDIRQAAVWPVLGLRGVPLIQCS